MIEVQLFTGDGIDDSDDYGIHAFLAAPRAGERVLAVVDGKRKRLQVEEVLNYSTGASGGRSEPHIKLRVRSC